LHDDSDEDEEMANFVRKLKRGTGKYKGKLPLKCFNCGKIGHFSTKCPYAKNSESDEEEVPKKEKKYQKETRKETKKILQEKSSTQEKIVPHLMRMMIVTVTQKEYSLWHLKMMKNIMKKKVK
jgi:hypothetical protein